MKKNVTATEMLECLKWHWDYAYRLYKDFGAQDERTSTHFDMCIGMKEMCEYLLGTPIGLGMDGVLRVGNEAL